jgi:hypothetical protein
VTEEFSGYKPFQEKAAQKFDPFAKNVSSQFLLDLTDDEGNTLFYITTPVLEQEEQYKKYDYIVYSSHDNSKVKVETECKAVWTVEGQWQYYPSGVHVPVRKRYSTADLFIMVNKSGNTLCVCRMEEVKQSQVVVKSTAVTYTDTKTKNEMFFNVPLEKVLFFTHTEAGWQQFKHN